MTDRRALMEFGMRHSVIAAAMLGAVMAPALGQTRIEEPVSQRLFQIR